MYVSTRVTITDTGEKVLQSRKLLARRIGDWEEGDASARAPDGAPARDVGLVAHGAVDPPVVRVRVLCPRLCDVVHEVAIPPVA